MAESHVLLGVGGSIAAYKAASIASALVKAGLDVRCVLTPGATHFVTPLTFEALTGNTVSVDIWDERAGTSHIGHIDLARWAHVIAIAPASASLLARLALGLADDMLTAIALSTRAPLLVAPAMETGMWLHPATQAHVDLLRSRGALIAGPATGRLASGAEGEGRMSEPDAIVNEVFRILSLNSDLEGVRVLVTAGPTYEAIDPVRFIGNRSSGKMGFAVAEEARDRGADVFLITGPTALPDPPGMEVVHVESTAEMERAALQRAVDRQVIIMAAAIADFRPAHLSEVKIKRTHDLSLQLIPNSDLAARLTAVVPSALHVGFALETGDLIQAARDKMRRKGQSLVVANAITPQHNPFGNDSNQVTFVTEETVRELEPMSKRQVARALWDEICSLLTDGRRPTA